MQMQFVSPQILSYYVLVMSYEFLNIINLRLLMHCKHVNLEFI